MSVKGVAVALEFKWVSVMPKLVLTILHGENGDRAHVHAVVVCASIEEHASMEVKKTAKGWI